MREKDHIEDYFKKHLEHYEESPDEDFWAKVAPAIEVQKERNNYRLLWILLLFLSLLLTGFLVKSIAWDQDLEFGKEEKQAPIATEEVFVDDLIDLNGQVPAVKEEQPIQEEERAQKTQFLKEEQPKLANEMESIEVFSEVIKLKEQGITNPMTISTNSLIKIQSLNLELLPNKIAEANYVAPELPKEPRLPLRVQPYATIHSYQGQSVIYEGIRMSRSGTEEQISFNPTNQTNLNLGLDAGVLINQRFYVQLGYDQNFGELTHEGTVGKNLSEQEIAIMADGIPINFDFTMNTYFDELTGQLKLTLNTTEIETGRKSFSIAAQRKVQTTRWMLATAYKIDINNIIFLTPKIGINQVTTKYQEYTQISGKETRLDAKEQMLESQLNVDANQTSMNENLQLKNVEGVLGFQAEIPLSQSRKWLIVPTGELWFDLTPSLEQTNLTLRKTVLTIGAGLRYNIN